MDWVYLLQDKDDTSRQGRKTKKKKKKKKGRHYAGAGCHLGKSSEDV